MSLHYNSPTVIPVTTICEYCGLDLVTKRKLLNHVNSVHDELVLQNIQDVIEFVIGDVGGVIESSSSSSSSAVNASNSQADTSSSDSLSSESEKTKRISSRRKSNL